MSSASISFSGTPYSGVEIKVAGAARQLDHVVRVVDGLKMPAAVFVFDQARDALVDHTLAEAFGDQIHELLAAQNAQGVVGIHDCFYAGRAGPSPCR